VLNGESFNIYQGRIGSSVTELQRLEFCVSRMRNLVLCYFVFKNQSHYSGVCGQRVNPSQNFLLLAESNRHSSQICFCIRSLNYTIFVYFPMHDRIKP